MAKLTPEIKAFIDRHVNAAQRVNYSRLQGLITHKYGVRISRSTISRRAKVLSLQFRPGRKSIRPAKKAPARTIFLDCAGAFFLKGAELELGLLETIQQLLITSTESAQARRVLHLAQKINSTLLYAPIFGLSTSWDIANYKGKGLLYLTGQDRLPAQKEIEQYLQFLMDSKLLVFVIKEVAKRCAEAAFIQVDFSKQSFYLDGQLRTVWPNAKIPRYFSSTLYNTSRYVRDILQSSNPKRPLILQICPGYTFLPTEMFNLISCLEQAPEEGINKVVIADKSAQVLKAWQKLKPNHKSYFIAPLSPWQYANLQGKEIGRDFSTYRVGPEKESMQIADAQIELFNPQLREKIKVRAALVRRKEERLALITNISRPEQRYIRQIAEYYFWRWPNSRLSTYYDLREEAQKEIQERANAPALLTPLLKSGYNQRPLEGFSLLLEYLHQYALARFFPSEYAGNKLSLMRERFYQQPGYLKNRSAYWQVFLRAVGEKRSQENTRAACEKFNQSGLELPFAKRPRLYLKVVG